MADLAQAVVAGLEAVEPVPTHGSDLIRYAGGRRALTEQLSGLNGPPRAGDYPDGKDDPGFKADHTRWRSASRRVQRYSDEKPKGGQQTRGTSGVKLTDAQRGRVLEEARTRKWADLYRHGARVRLDVTMRDGRTTRKRTMPSGGPGVFIPPEQLDAVLANLDGGDVEQGAFDLLVDFGEDYGFDLADSYLQSVDGVSIWPEGAREPG